jgi:hypothetical protein
MRDFPPSNHRRGVATPFMSESLRPVRCANAIPSLLDKVDANRHSGRNSFRRSRPCEDRTGYGQGRVHLGATICDDLDGA